MPDAIASKNITIFAACLDVWNGIPLDTIGSIMWLRVPSPRVRRGLIAAAALLGQLASAFGMPLPAFHRKDTSRPFPCMSHSCGCMNLEEFWESCCCYTNAEKVAWAEANNVWAPDFVREAARREKTKTKKSCCCDKKGDTCCKQAAAHDSCPKCKTAKVNEHKSSPVQWVLGFAAKRCGGHGQFGISQAAPSIPASAPLVLSLNPVFIEMLFPRDEDAMFCQTLPVVPPPRTGQTWSF
jgi:hypothetical protein